MILQRQQEPCRAWPSWWIYLGICLIFIPHGASAFTSPATIGTIVVRRNSCFDRRRLSSTHIFQYQDDDGYEFIRKYNDHHAGEQERNGGGNDWNVNGAFQSQQEQQQRQHKKSRSEENQATKRFNVSKKSGHDKEKEDPLPVAPAIASPARAMIWVDGTWLYYSLYERDRSRSSITQRFGSEWAFNYYFDWSALPKVVCKALYAQDPGWSSLPAAISGGKSGTRHVQAIRTSAYTSFKIDTPKTSLRYKMFQSMIKSNYDVQIMETVGIGEKCVDIQLAVDMLYYADTYDIAVILTGDKDFMPAMIRARQMGKRVCLVSMRLSCNTALYQTPNVKDNIIWIEDYLDELIKPIPQKKLRQNNYLSTYTIVKIACDCLTKSPDNRVSSRALGRLLKHIKVGPRSVLEEIKQRYGGIHQFITVIDCFEKKTASPDEKKEEGGIMYWICLTDDYKGVLTRELSTTEFTDDEKQFFRTYNPDLIGIFDEDDDGEDDTDNDNNEIEDQNDSLEVSPVQSSESFNDWTLVRLRNYCKDRGLPISGKKAEVVERLQQDMEKKKKKASSPHLATKTEEAKEKVSMSYIDNLVNEYMQVCGGEASSRNLGRFLAANKASPEISSSSDRRISALEELKTQFGSLKNFTSHSEFFDTEEYNPDSEDFDGPKSFKVVMKNSEHVSTR